MKNIFNICFIGGGGHSISCADVLEQNKNMNIVGFLDPSKNSSLGKQGYQRLGNDDYLKEIVNKYKNIFISLGQIKLSTKRKELFNQAKLYNAHIPILISQFAYISSKSAISEGSIIMNGAVVNSNVIIKQNCIINSNALIEHDAIINEHVHIAPSSTILGNVTIGKESFIGAGAVIREGVKIGEKVFIKAGEIVKYDRN